MEERPDVAKEGEKGEHDYLRGAIDCDDCDPRTAKNRSRRAEEVRNAQPLMLGGGRARWRRRGR